MKKFYMIRQALCKNLVPSWMIWAQVICFSVLYAVWALPETILIRHICLIVGAVIGVYEIYQLRTLLFSKLNSANAAVWMLVSLFVWASFHLIFLGANFSMQAEEFSSIWKRTALGAVFALGLGLALSGRNSQEQKIFWPIFYLGLLAPTLIYALKYTLTHYGSVWGISAPAYLRLHYSSFPFYLPKTNYVCFCLPTLAVALGQLKLNIGRHLWFSRGNLVYIMTIPAVFFVFYGENIKNGVIYGIFLVLVFATQLFLLDFKNHWIRKSLLAAILMMAGTGFLINHIQKNESWKTFAVDAQIAINTDRYDHWKFNGAKGYPNNELGEMVSMTNYERIAWGREGLILLAQHPLGYGLVERSFGHLAKREWPESNLHQTHSGWLDLALGIGIPGVTLILVSVLLSMRAVWRLQAEENERTLEHILAHPFKSPWISSAWWILLASLLMWCTTEISQKIFFDSLIFWVALASGLVAGAQFQEGLLIDFSIGNKKQKI